jgi:hypothetical protein
MESQLAAIAAYLRGELGFETETPGALRRQVEEQGQTIRTIDETLRGRGEELGLVGWMMVLRRTWITMVALLGAAFGYVMNDVIDTVEAASANRAATGSQAVSAPAD